MFKLIAGPCAVESETICMEIASHMKNIAERHNLDYYFKASFDKANRTSFHSPRGPGINSGLRILQKVKDTFGVKILTDIHEERQASEAARVADVIQIPALLCRQTDLLVAAAETGRIVNVKKGQFMSADSMASVVDKLEEAGGAGWWITERGTSFGYNHLIVDMPNLIQLKQLGPVIFDATHSVQRPNSGSRTQGDGWKIPVLARAAVAVGVDGLFFETHPSPRQAISDGPNMVPLEEMGPLIHKLMKIREAVECSQ